MEREAVSKSTRPSDEDGASSAAPPTNHPTLGTRWREEEEDPAVGKNRIDPGEEIESFFGQLWAIPAAPPHVRAPVGEGFLAWVRRDLVRDRAFTLADCYLVKKSDRIEGKPTQISFARDLWGRGGRQATYAEVLRRSTMGEGRR